MAPDSAPTVTRPGDDAAGAARHARPPLKTDCWFLSGPTASGKTALAVRLARRLDAEIVSVDSMAVYRGLDIGTAKPTPADRAAVTHHVIDAADPAEAFSVARWLAAAAAAVEEIRSRSRRILFVGGTPLYLRALRDGLAPLPPGDPEYRRRLSAEAQAGGTGALHARLAAIDPAAARRIHPHDERRIIRALEVAHVTGRPLTAAFAPVPHSVFDSQLLVVDLPRRLLYDRIDRRVEAMFAAGLVDETRLADARPGGIGPTARQAAGYAESLDVIAGRLSLVDAVRRTQDRTRQLAKRQLTWLRSFRNAIWVTA
ncbi:MAG: tRNA (adenosine(37)-N6)-dimethylallyltransferase MiaA [Planctomycetia bacterium]|nr:tRNA (adenosine(37)-N6)-dimethylallyltransferase MiaA [Planctomycetia bacterium]